MRAFERPARTDRSAGAPDPSVPASVHVAVKPPTAPIQAAIDTGAAPIQALVDAVAAAVETIRGTIVA